MRTAPDSVSERWLARFLAAAFGLQSKATILVVGLLTLIAAALCSLAVRAAWSLTTRMESDQALQLAAAVARFSSDELERGDGPHLEWTLRQLVAEHPLGFLQITTPTGKVVASACARDWQTPKGLGTDPPPALIGVPTPTSLPKPGGTYLEVIYPITPHDHGTDVKPDQANGLLGYVRLGMSRNRTIAEFDAAADLVIGIGIAVVLLSIPTGFLLVRRIVAPLNKMSSMARRFSAGDLSARSDVKRTDEIGVLANNLNAMADEIARKHGEVLALNTELEQRVMERTAQLRELAVREPLTGLYNRRHFAEVLARRFAEARRYQTELSLLMIDMDDFKDVNDRYGHQTGDELLVAVAYTISNQLRSADVAARYGGDEFIVLLPQARAEQAEILAQRIAEQFEAERLHKTPEVPVSLSIGIACLSESGAITDEQFVQAADRALYEAKAQGRNRVVRNTLLLQ